MLLGRASGNREIEVVKTGRRHAFSSWRKRRPFVGAALTVLAGCELFFSGQLDVGKIHVQVGIEGLQATIIPLALVLLGILVMAMPAHRIFYGVLVLALSIYSLIGVNLGGFFIGMLLSAVGGVLIVSWMPKPATAGRDTPADGTADPGETAEAAPTEPLPLARRRS